MSIMKEEKALNREQFVRFWRKIQEHDRKNGFRKCFNKECDEELCFSHFYFEYLKHKAKIDYRDASLWSFDTFIKKHIENKVSYAKLSYWYLKALEVWKVKIVEIYCCKCIGRVEELI